MKTKVKIWAITADIHNCGLDTELYGSIEEVRAQQKLIIEENISQYCLCSNGKPKPGPDCEKLAALIAENKIEEAWDYFIDEEGFEHPRSPDDCWHVNEHTVELDVRNIPGVGCTDCHEAAEDPGAEYHATPCGSFCESCMDEHMRECGCCAKEFGREPSEEALRAEDEAIGGTE